MKASNLNIIFLITVIAICSVSTTSYRWHKNRLLENYNSHLSHGFINSLKGLGKDLRDNGCHFNLCFALQGDDFITDQEFEDQKNFVDLIVSILSSHKHGDFCAVQYGKKLQPISPLTSRSIQFVRMLRRQKRVGGTAINIGAALRYVGSQFTGHGKKPNKLIILGDNFMSDDFVPKRLPWKLRKEYVDISVVGIGGVNLSTVNSLVRGDLKKVLEIQSFFELKDIIVGLLVDVCEFKGKQFF